MLLVGAFWAIYGLMLGLIDGVLEPVIDFGAQVLQNVGLSRVRGYSGIETLVSRGQYEAAADAYLERAREGPGDSEAMVRRAALLAGPLASPELAVTELEQLREGGGLDPASEIRVGLALADI